MCGICGIVYFDKTRPVERGTLERMMDRMSHRGPDDAGFFIDGNVGLGHRRLSIIDLSNGKQPMLNEDGSVAVVFNGEIYNHAELSPGLMAKGHKFRTRCDTEAILHSYEELGAHCVQDFRGMFGFAIWDRARQRLFMARDRLGVKPLYYYVGREFFVFASEIKSLLEHPAVPHDLDPDALSFYLALRYVPGPRTMFRNIYKLQPGHTLSLENGVLSTSKYWDIPYGNGGDRSDAECVEKFRKLLEESVRLRLMAEVPLGVFLSGGIDSGTILAVMSRLNGGQRVKTFSVGYEENHHQDTSDGVGEANEFSYARMAAAAFGAEHHEFRVGARQFGEFVPNLVWHLDEPLADPSCIPLYFLSRLAREHITVVLSGEGADETLAGYGIYQKMLAVDMIYRSLSAFSGVLSSQIARMLPSEAQRSYMRLAGFPLAQRYRGVSRGFRPETLAKLLGGDPHRLLDVDEHLNEHYRPYYHLVRGEAALNRMLYVDTKVWLPDDILLKADKMTMANALELRVPFLDHKLVEFCAQLPVRMKLRKRTGKFLLREAMRNVLPTPILERSKKGFPVPIAQWFRGPLREVVHDALLSRDSACADYMAKPVIESLLEEHESRRVARDQEIWSLLVFEYWHRIFVKGTLEPNLKAEQVAAA